MASDFLFFPPHYSYSSLVVPPHSIMSTGYAQDFMCFFPCRSGHRLWCTAFCGQILGDWSRWFLLFVVSGIEGLFMPSLTLHASSCTLTTKIYDLNKKKK